MCTCTAAKKDDSTVDKRNFNADGFHGLYFLHAYVLFIVTLMHENSSLTKQLFKKVDDKYFLFFFVMSNSQFL